MKKLLFVTLAATLATLAAGNQQPRTETTDAQKGGDVND